MPIKLTCYNFNYNYNNFFTTLHLEILEKAKHLEPILKSIGVVYIIRISVASLLFSSGFNFMAPPQRLGGGG